MFSDELDKILHDFNVKMGEPSNLTIKPHTLLFEEENKDVLEGNKGSILDYTFFNAVKRGRKPTIEHLLGKNADINCLNCAPLRLACINNRFDIVEFLLKWGHGTIALALL